MKKIDFRIFKNRYTITIVTPTRADKGYLGATVRQDKIRFGVLWKCGNDLHDGEYNWKTFFGIVSDIFCYQFRCGQWKLTRSNNCL